MNNQDTIVWIQITSGSGPEECCLAVSHIYTEFQQEAAREAVRSVCLEVVPSKLEGNYKSVLLVLQGKGARELASRWEGPVQWICPSPYRPEHKRKNWFAGVTMFSPPGAAVWNEHEIRIQCTKSGGPGGQHVNKTETAVRVTHLPTGLTAEAREERSQWLNKKLAMARLLVKFEDEIKHSRDRVRKELWKDHKYLERGNPTRTYKGKDFQLFHTIASGNILKRSSYGTA